MSLSLAENVIIVGADNRPPMLDKSNYSSWASRMLFYIKGKPNGKLLVDSVLNGPFQFGSITVPGTKTTPATVRERTYTDLTAEEKLRESVDIIATNIVLQGLPQDIFNLVNHNDQAKQIWDRVKLLIQGSELTQQELNTKVVNHLLPEWGKFVTDVKLAKNMHTTNIDHLYAHLRQHEAHANKLDQYSPQLSNVTHSQYSPSASQMYDVQQYCYSPHAPQFYDVPSLHSTPYQATTLDSGLVVPLFNTSDDLVVNLNKPIAFLTSYASRFSPTNNQLRTSSNPWNQATIQDGRIGGQEQLRMIKCYNCQEDGHMVRDCTKPKRTKNFAWFKEKMLLTEALQSGACLDPEQLAFLADNGDDVIPA
ncbi:zf-CCHC domain-containing protein [Tanacetum coccineum]